MVRLPNLRRGKCGVCEEVTDWYQGTARGIFSQKLVVQCSGCNRTLTATHLGGEPNGGQIKA